VKIWNLQLLSNIIANIGLQQIRLEDGHYEVSECSYEPKSLFEKLILNLSTVSTNVNKNIYEGKKKHSYVFWGVLFNY
jgi:hypothetical protein